MIGIIDYGAGNLRSVSLAFQRCGADTTIVTHPSSLNQVNMLVLPGVGSFYSASKMLADQGWKTAIWHQLARGKKLLGICLGMQLLFDYGTEDGHSNGLGIIGGSVDAIYPEKDIRVPHIGWNSVYWNSDHPVIKDIPSGIDFYHVHSYHCIPNDSTNVLAHTTYGTKLVTAVATNQVIGLQFHPEKSQPAGLKLLQNFIEWGSAC
jgi:glutamine amidotransferase